MATKPRKAKKRFPKGRCKIKTSFNNTIVSITDPSGNVISWASAGSAGFKGSRKSTPYAAQVAAAEVGKKAKEEFGMKEVDVEVIGPGSRESAVQAINAAGLKVTSIRDRTPIPHNGCRPRKKRRV